MMQGESPACHVLHPGSALTVPTATPDSGCCNIAKPEHGFHGPDHHKPQNYCNILKLHGNSALIAETKAPLKTHCLHICNKLPPKLYLRARDLK